MIPQEVLKNNRRLMRVLQPVNQIISRMGEKGVPLSREVLFYKAEKWKERILARKEDLFNLVGQRLNLASYIHLRNLLYGKKWDKNFTGSWSLECDPVIDDKNGELTSNQFALAKLHYHYGRCQTCKGAEHACESCQASGRDRTERILHLVREIKLLQHRYSNFVAPFIDWTDCAYCVGDDEEETGKRRSKKDKYNKGECPHCGGTGVGKVTGHNPRYVTIKDDWWWFHPTYLQTPNTLRFACVDRNIQQFARYLATFDIAVRDIIVAPPGYKLWSYDYSKAERWGAAIIFRSGSILEELTDKDAYARLGSQIFQVPYEQCRKGSPIYPGTKTFVLATQYQAHKKTIKRTVMQMCGIDLTDDMLNRGFDLIYKQVHKEYYDNVREHAWKCYQRGYAVSIHGALFRIPKDLILKRFEHYTEIPHYPNKYVRKEAWAAFERICRAVSAFIVQSSMTGLAAQLMLLKSVDTLDRWMNPAWSEFRHLNGNWDIMFPFITKHDENGFCGKDDLVEEGMARHKQVLLNFDDWSPYLPSRTDSLKFPLEVEPWSGVQFDVTLPKNHAEMTKAKNPNHYYEDGIMFKQ